MKISVVPALALLAVCSIAAKPAFAGFIAVSSDEVTSNGSTTMSGTFTDYTPDTLNDPQINGDLSSYHYVLNFTAPITSAFATDTGTYEIYYQNASIGPIQVSAGTVSVFGNSTDFNGGLLQTPVTGGPGNPAFADFSVVYGTPASGLAVSLTGSKLIISQPAPALTPEPATIGVLALAGFGLVRRRRSV